jgi:hypothetical protein
MARLEHVKKNIWREKAHIRNGADARRQPIEFATGVHCGDKVRTEGGFMHVQPPTPLHLGLADRRYLGNMKSLLVESGFA